jgi:large subunit ribosomal protein L16
MLIPKKTKFRKYMKGKIPSRSTNQTLLKFGLYGIKANTPGIITAKTIEAVRRAITRKFKRAGKIWITIFPSISITEKPLEVRMGKGKGKPSFWVCKVKAGQILFEMDGISLELAKQAGILAYHKLPIKTSFIYN